MKYARRSGHVSLAVLALWWAGAAPLGRPHLKADQISAGLNFSDQDEATEKKGLSLAELSEPMVVSEPGQDWGVLDMPAPAEAAAEVHKAALGLPDALQRHVQPGLAPVPDVRPLARDEAGAAHQQARPAVQAPPAADIEIVKQALIEYRRGRITEGDALAAKAEGPAAQLALEWAAIRMARQSLGFPRLARFARENPAFPMADWVRRRAEEALFVEKRSGETILAFFNGRTPEMAAGAIALARVRQQRGETGDANALVREAWRDRRTNQATRSAILREFPEAISIADRQYLAEKLIYDGNVNEGLGVASGAGGKAAALAPVLAASVNETGGALALVQKLDAALQNEPAALFAKAQHFRRANQPQVAAQAILAAPVDPDRIADGDEWWIERRMLARKLLDAGDPDTAYKVAAGHVAQSDAMQIDAEIHAGWIALRFLNRADLAQPHFDMAYAVATAPPSLSRAAYWRGRAAEALGLPEATDFYRDAARHGHTYHGQLAAARLPDPVAATAEPDLSVSDLEHATRSYGMRAIRVLLEADARDLAQPLIADAAQKASNHAEAVAVGDLAARFGLTRLTLLAGKLALQRGLPAKEHAFPVFGIPPYEQTADMAERAIVYSIARQESEFNPKAISHAGARGLMQLMPATARRTASKAKLPFDVNALTADPALNVRIGATHLGELFGEYRGSYVMSFAAYNAGGGRVREWVRAYGDPRDPAVDTVDWIERIPITETRHYVQKVLENVQVYRELLDRQPGIAIGADLERGARRPKTEQTAAVP